MISDLSHARAHVNIYTGKEVKGGGVGEPIRNHGGERLDLFTVLSNVQIPLLLRTVEFIDAWSEWIEHRLECGSQYRWPTTVRCFKKTMKQCEAWGSSRAIKAIDHSIMMGYRGLFEPRVFYVEQKPKHVNGTIHTGVQGRVY